MQNIQPNIRTMTAASSEMVAAETNQSTAFSFPL